MREPLTFQKFHLENILRNEEVFPTCKEWNYSDWFLALVGEVGELGNLLKKLKRQDFTENEIRRQLADEIADVQTYLDLLAGHLNINLEKAVRLKFNEVSERFNSSRRL